MIFWGRRKPQQNGARAPNTDQFELRWQYRHLPCTVTEPLVEAQPIDKCLRSKETLQPCKPKRTATIPFTKSATFHVW
jgi:hypothetical protein